MTWLAAFDLNHSGGVPTFFIINFQSRLTGCRRAKTLDRHDAVLFESTKLTCNVFGIAAQRFD